MEAITLTIDGRALSARAGLTILEIARQHDIQIPTLCHHELLRPIGACRLCQVELTERSVVVPACVTQAAAGMVIETASERVLRNRRNILRLIMAAHPESCLVCEKGNACQLRNLAAQYGVGAYDLDRMPYHPAVVDLNPFLARDLSKCILCAKCIRADQEAVVEGVLDYNLRGFDAHPASLFARPLEEAGCTFCGTCLSACPTGAIFEKNKPRLDHAAGRNETVCGFCACGCSLLVEHDCNQVVGVGPSDQAHTANGLTLCVKGHFGWDHLASRERLVTPLINQGEGLQPASWDQALELIASEMGRISDQQGAQALGFIGSGRASNEENYLLQKLARGVVGTNNLDSAARLYWSPAAEVLRRATGFAAGSASMDSLAASEVILLIGGDPTRSAPVVGYHLKRALKAGAQLILVDSLQTKLAPLARLWLQPRLGGDQALLCGLLKVILDQGLCDTNFLGSKAAGFEELAAALDKLSLADCARRAGVSQKQMDQAARLLAGAHAACFIFGRGLMQQPGALELVKLLVDLDLLTGNLAREGGGLIPLLADCNTQGALDMGVHPGWLPGQRPLDDAAGRAALKQLWSREPPAEAGRDYPAMIRAAASGRLGGLFVLADDPLEILPGRQRVQRALAKLPLLVVQDMFLSQTARLAKVVLPLAGFAEKEGTVTNLERRVQRLGQATPPPGDFPPGWQVLTRLANLLGADWDYGSAWDVWAEIERAVPLYRGLGRASQAKRATFWPLPGNEEVNDTLPHGIGLPDGRALLLRPRLNGRGGLPEVKGYPYVLLQGRVTERQGGGLRSSRSARLTGLAPEAWLGVSATDFQRLGLNGGDRLRVRSPHGSLELPARLDQRLPKGVLFVPASYPGLGLNQLWDAAWGQDGSPAAMHCRVSLRKV